MPVESVTSPVIFFTCAEQIKERQIKESRKVNLRNKPTPCGELLCGSIAVVLELCRFQNLVKNLESRCCLAVFIYANDYERPRAIESGDSGPYVRGFIKPYSPFYSPPTFRVNSTIRHGWAGLLAQTEPFLHHRQNIFRRRKNMETLFFKNKCISIVF